MIMGAFIDSILCSAGCTAVEDVHHLFLKCPIFGAVWNDIISWLWVSCVLPDKTIALASQFCGGRLENPLGAAFKQFG
jgi:hypothetical protein